MPVAAGAGAAGVAAAGAVWGGAGGEVCARPPVQDRTRAGKTT